MTRIAITGIGVVGPGAIGIYAFSALLDRSHTAATPIDCFATDSLRAHTGAVLSRFRPPDFFAPMKTARRGNISRFRVGSLAHSNAVVDECARPFDRRRNGMVVVEGGAVVIAEAAPRKQPYAFASGFGIARDTTASISDWGDGAGAVAAAMRAAIEDAELSFQDIDAIYASANATGRADRLESRAIQLLFRDVPPVGATKGYFGEYGAGGALQLVAAILAIRDRKLHASAGFARADDGLVAPTQRP